MFLVLNSILSSSFESVNNYLYLFIAVVGVIVLLTILITIAFIATCSGSCICKLFWSGFKLSIHTALIIAIVSIYFQFNLPHTNPSSSSPTSTSSTLQTYLEQLQNVTITGIQSLASKIEKH